MAKALSQDLRDRVVAAIDGGLSLVQYDIRRNETRTAISSRIDKHIETDLDRNLIAADECPIAMVVDDDHGRTFLLHPSQSVGSPRAIAKAGLSAI